MFSSVGIGWKKARGGQTKTWQKSMKSLTSGLSHVGRCRLRGWGPRDESHQWLETLNDMAQNRSQWRRCIHSLSVVPWALRSRSQVTMTNTNPNTKSGCTCAIANDSEPCRSRSLTIGDF
ncbi:endonuclease-reverse transcriptase, partial [Schistosoma japonicum]